MEMKRELYEKALAAQQQEKEEASKETATATATPTERVAPPHLEDVLAAITAMWGKGIRKVYIHTIRELMERVIGKQPKEFNKDIYRCMKHLKIEPFSIKPFSWYLPFPMPTLVAEAKKATEVMAHEPTPEEVDALIAEMDAMPPIEPVPLVPPKSPQGYVPPTPCRQK